MITAFYVTLGIMGAIFIAWVAVQLVVLIFMGLVTLYENTGFWLDRD